ncbi:MAG: hydroxymethylbilane synthase [Pseudomonadota bacterium]
MSAQPQIKLGTRGSPLALAQAHEVAARLRQAHPELAPAEAISIKVIKTTGDKVLDRPLSEIGGKGLFTKEIEEALIDGSIDAAVHSMKDVPTWLPDGLEIPVILPREDPRDAWIGRDGLTLAALPSGAVVGSASLRRQALVKARRPDLEVVTLRGNVGTRLRKLEAGEVDGTLLAMAGLKRLDMVAAVTEALAPEVMLPAVAQGAIGLETRCGDEATRALVDAINDPMSAARVRAERACLAVLDGSCRTPISAFAELENGRTIRLRALVALPDGSALIEDERQGPLEEAEMIGTATGQALRQQAEASQWSQAFSAFFG